MRAVVVMIVLTGCRQVFGLEPPLRGDAAVNTATDTADASLGDWSAAVEIVELSSASGEDDPSLTDDLLEIYFGSRRPGTLGGEDIWVATRATVASSWGTPINVDVLNTSASETTAKISGDGLAIFLTSNRITGDADIYFATRTSRSSAWGQPVRVAELCTAGGDYSASASAGLLHLVMASGATVADEALHTSDRASTSDAWGPPVRIAELDTPGQPENDPFEPVPNVIYYRSGTTEQHLFVTRRASVTLPYGPPVELVGPNQAGTNDSDPWVSADERILVFASDRSGISQLYVSTR